MNMNRMGWIQIACLAALLTACAGASREYVLTGKLDNCTGNYALLGGNDAGEMDTIAIASDGTFRYAKTFGASSMSFLMLEKGGVFPLLLIDGTENHLEADLATPGQYRITGDLEAAYTFYNKHIKDFSQITEEQGNSFKGCKRHMLTIDRRFWFVWPTFRIKASMLSSGKHWKGRFCRISSHTGEDGGERYLWGMMQTTTALWKR